MLAPVCEAALLTDPVSIAQGKVRSHAADESQHQFDVLYNYVVE